MQKAFDFFNWQNYPSEDTPLSRNILMKVNNGLNAVDDRVIALDTTKFDKTEAQGLIKNLTLNPSNGVFTITYFNGATATFDTLLEKLAVNFDFDETTQRMVIYLSDGTEKYVDLSAFIVPLEFIDSLTIDFQLLESGKVTAIVKEGSIEEKHLRPNYLADIKLEVAKATASESSAAQSAANAENDAKLAQSYAVGGTGIREGEDADNAKKYKELAEQAYENLQNSDVTGVKGDEETEYRKGNVNITKENIGLGNVPNVATNDQTPTFMQAATRENIASGNKLSVILGKIMKWFADLKTVAFTGSYTDLTNQPQSLKNPNAITFTGAVTGSYDGSAAKSVAIPSVGNGTLTIQKNGANVQTFTANQSGNVTANITVPTNAAGVGAVATSKVLTTVEQIDANTNASNVAGATAIKVLKSDLTNSISQINSNLNNVTLLAVTTITTLTTTTLASKLSNFRVLVVNVRSGGRLIKSMIVDTSSFINTSSMPRIFINNDIWIDINYVSNTVIQHGCTAGSYFLHIFGFNHI